jgi:hypothetical protein
MSVIFISHSSEDRTLAQDLAGRLRLQGYDALFLDFDLSDGIPAGSGGNVNCSRRCADRMD